MTADIVNLRRARKAKARAGREAEAAQNRIKFGRTKAEKERTKREAELQVKRLDGARRDEAEQD